MDQPSLLDQPSLPEARQVFEIERGMYVLRYKSSPERLFPPTVYVTPLNDDVELIWHPDHAQSLLPHPGLSVVVKVRNKAGVFIDVVASVPDGSTDAEIAFEALPGGTLAAAGDNVRRVKVSQAKSAAVVLRGHLSSLGDKTVDGGEWLGGPKAPLRIEAIALKWRERPQDQTLRYGATSIGAPAGQPVAMVEEGALAGTQGRGLGLRELVIEIAGQGAGRHELRGEAMFLGAAVQPFQGTRVHLRGPSLREPLVGLCLDIVERSGSSGFAGPVAVAAGAGQSTSGTAGTPGAVRVSRAPQPAAGDLATSVPAAAAQATTVAGSGSGSGAAAAAGGGPSTAATAKPVQAPSAAALAAGGRRNVRIFKS